MVHILYIPICIFYTVARPSNSVFTSCGDFGLHATRNFYVTHRDGDDEIQIGLWHVLPNYIAKRFSKELNLSEVNNLNYCKKNKL